MARGQGRHQPCRDDGNIRKGVVGVGIFVMNLDASREVYKAARDERREADPPYRQPDRR